MLYCVLKHKSISTEDISSHFSLHAVNVIASLLYLDYFYKELDEDKVSKLLMMISEKAGDLETSALRKTLFCLYTMGTKTLIQRFMNHCKKDRIA